MKVREKKQFQPKQICREKRPSIPADVVRIVLVEAGHRCAVCGEPCPLEHAHIRPWRDTQDHTANNLIVLCASCHQRADLEGWGENTLRMYKEKPWIYRKALEKAPAKLRRVEICLDLDLAGFADGGEEILRFALAGFLRIKPEDVVVRTIEEGSVKVTIDLPPEAAEGLLKAFANRDAGLFRTLRPLLLKGIRDRGEIFVVSGIDKSDYFDEDDCESLSLEVTSQVAKTCREVGVQMIHLITTSTLDEIYFEAIEPSDIIKRHVSECQTCKAKLTETRRLIKQGPERMEVFKKSDLPSMSLPLCVFYLNSTTQDLADFTRETLALTNELIWIWSPGERADPGFDPNDGTKERSRSRRSRSK